MVEERSVSFRRADPEIVNRGTGGGGGGAIVTTFGQRFYIKKVKFGQKKERPSKSVCGFKQLIRRLNFTSLRPYVPTSIWVGLKGPRRAVSLMCLYLYPLGGVGLYIVGMWESGESGQGRAE